MDTRAVTPPDRPEAPSEAAVPPSAAVGAPTSPAPLLSWTGDDALSEFPTESEVRRDRSPARAVHRARTRRIWPILAALAVVAIAAGVAWRWWPGGAAVPAPGTLAIETSPPGAALAVDGRERGATPLTLSLPAGVHTLTLTGPAGRRELSVTVVAGSQIVHHVELGKAAPTTGRLQVSGPARAPILLDGTRRGVTPAELTDVPAGEHTVTVGEGAAAVTQRVLVPAGGLASLLVPLGSTSGQAPAWGGQAPAWISIVAPIELQVFDGQALIGNSSASRILVLAGRHTLGLVNTELGYQGTRTVEVEPGRVTTVRVEVPNGVLNVNALPWAEVLVDGRRVGETPIANLAVPIGTHEVTLRNPRFAEQKRSVVISLAGPVRVGVDLRQ